MSKRSSKRLVVLTGVASLVASLTAGIVAFHGPSEPTALSSPASAQAKGRASGAGNAGDSTVLLPGPTLDGWSGLNVAGLAVSNGRLPGYPMKAQARYYRTDIVAGPAKKPRVIGYARRGAVLPAKARVYGKGCPGGHWYPVIGGGYVCTSAGFRVGKKLGPLGLHYKLPAIDRPLPYDYAELRKQGALRYYRLPSAKDAQMIALAGSSADKLPSIVDRAMNGVFFFAKATVASDKDFVRTVYGRYVRADVMESLPVSKMHGEQLGRRFKLPLAFVYGEDRPVFRATKGSMRRVGVARKHARFHVAATVRRGGETYVKTPEGLLLRRAAVRVAKRLARPADVPAGKKWIHVNLREQTLVAYRGDRAVLATVVSSGKAGHEPPRGIFRIRSKHVTVTMDGPDPVDGWYEVEEVPWSMYYWKGFALHGAYWHDDFGTPRSHGCTNLAPADARWLFDWATPVLPAGWHGVDGQGTWVKVTS